MRYEYIFSACMRTALENERIEELDIHGVGATVIKFGILSNAV